ncbi:MAG: DegT/DnrJ/EryC1/StrS family aminotransferase [Lentisphaeria bacterium]|nr:DegT/DnrJ/EryC1/StrS family aminotransferase [Lentisphaeria bacterium]
MAQQELAIDGGPKVRETPFPPRALLGEAERAAALALFDQAIASGQAFGYNGPPEQQYEKDFAAFMGGGFADAVNSGTNALYCALGALQLEPFSEVIVPAITDPGGIMPVPLLGLVPVVADTDPRSYNTTADAIEAMLSERTRAIVVAHIGGDSVDMDPVLALAAAHGLCVVEDCAQSQGALYKGRRAGTMGHIAAFSTMYGKHHCTGGQGGMVYTRDEELYWRARRFADRGKPFGIPTPAGNVTAGLNCNLNDLAAAIGSAQLRRLPEILAARIRVGNAVRDGLAEHPAVRVGWQVPDSQSTYWFLRLHVRAEALRVDKARFCQALAAEGIPVVPAYRAIPAEYPWFRERRVFGTGGFPWTCGDYTGPREPQAKIANAIHAVETHCNIGIHENCAAPEIEAILNAIGKVTRAYRR